MPKSSENDSNKGLGVLIETLSGSPHAGEREVAAEAAEAAEAAAQQAAGLTAKPWAPSVGTPTAPKKGVMDSIKAGFGYVGDKVASFCGAIGRGISSAASFVYRAIKAVVKAVVFIVCLPFKAVYAVGSFIGRGIAALFKAGYHGASRVVSRMRSMFGSQGAELALGQTPAASSKGIVAKKYGFPSDPAAAPLDPAEGPLIPSSR